MSERANHHKARTKKRGNKWSISWNWMQYAEDGQKTCQSMVKFSATLHTTEVNYKIPLFSLLWLVSDKGSEAPQGWIEWGNLLNLFLVTLHKLISSPTSLFPRLSLSLCPVYNHCKNTNQFGHSHEIYHRGCIYHHLYINSSVIQVTKRTWRQKETNLYSSLPVITFLKT